MDADHLRLASQDVLRDEVLTRGVQIDDRLDQVLGHAPVVGEQLLSVLRQAVAAVANEGLV